METKDLRMEAMRASGPGGQNVNKRCSAMRVTHIPSGIDVVCMEERFQHLNQKVNTREEAKDRGSHFDRFQIAIQRLSALLLQQKVNAATEAYSSARKAQVNNNPR